MTAERNVEVGGDVIHSIIVTGDHIQVFVGDYERLRDAYILPWPVFERVQLDRFVGRDWLLAEVDAFLRDNDRGLFVLEAAAGLGKTTFLAYLVRERGYIHHFVELAPGPDGVPTGLRNLAAQIVRTWKLDPYLAEGVVPGAAVRPDFLQKLLFEAARARDEKRPDEKIVLVVDALDEAGTPPGQNVLGLPRVLPQGVYLVVSQRPVDVSLRIDGPRRVFRLRPEDSENRADMRSYLEAAAAWPGVSNALKTRGYTPEDFVSALLDRCGGVWIYLHYVVGEIERGEPSRLDLETLPAGLWQYYAQYWARWREKPGWYGEYLPLLAALGAAQEALSVQQLCAFAGIPGRPEYRRLFAETWRPFLAEDRREGQPRYRLYHASLRDFFGSQADLESLTVAERSLAEELASATRQAHGHIADRYLEAWGGLEAALPGLRDPHRRDMDCGYGLRHLAGHLREAGRLHDLLAVLKTEWTEKTGKADSPVWYENAWYAAKQSIADTPGYLNDLHQARTMCVTNDAWSVGHGKLAAYLGEELFCALVETSMHSVTSQLDPDLVKSLIEERIWTVEQTLAHVAQVADPAAQAKIIRALAPLLDGEQLSALIGTVRGIPNPEARATSLIALADQLPRSARPDALSDAFAASMSVEDPATQLRLLVAVLSLYARKDSGRTEVVDRIVNLAKRIGDPEARARALAEVLDDIPDDLKPHVALKALEAVQDIRDLGYIETCVMIVPHLPKRALGKAVRDALAKVRNIGNPSDRAWALVELVPVVSAKTRRAIAEQALAASGLLPEDMRVAALELLGEHAPRGIIGRLLEAISNLRSENNRAFALRAIGPRIPKRRCREAIEIAIQIRNEEAKAYAFAALAPHVSPRCLRQLLAESRRISSKRMRCWALASVVPRLSQDVRAEMVRETIAVARASSYDDLLVVHTLESLAPYIPADLMGDAFALALDIGQDSLRSAALCALSRRLPRSLVRKALAIDFGMRDSAAFVRTLLCFVPVLPKGERRRLLRRAVAATSRSGDEIYRAKAGAALVPFLPPRRRQSVMKSILEFARSSPGARALPSALVALAPYLRGCLRNAAFEEAKRVVDEKDRIRAVCALALHDTSSAARQRVEEALELVAEAGDETVRAEGFRSLAPKLNSIMQERFISEVERIDSPPLRAQAAAALVPYVRHDRRKKILGELILSRPRGMTDVLPYVAESIVPHLSRDELAELVEAIADMWDPYPRAGAVAAVAAHVPDSLVGRLLEVARATRSDGARSKAIASVAPRLPCDLREPVIAEVLRSVFVGEIWPNQYTRFSLIEHLGPFLEPGVLEGLLAMVPEIRDPEERAYALRVLGAHAPFDLQKVALRMAVNIPSPTGQALALAGLAQYLPVRLRQKVLRLAALQVPRIPDGTRRAEVLRSIVASSESLPADCVCRAWADVLHRSANATRQDFLNDLVAVAPIVWRLGGERALIQTFRAIQDVGRWWP